MEHTTREGSLRGRSVRQIFNGLAALSTKLNKLSQYMKNANHRLHAIQVGCDNYRNHHSIKDWDLENNGKKRPKCVYHSTINTIRIGDRRVSGNLMKST